MLENKSLTNISRCTLESADKSNLSRFLSSLAPWPPPVVNDTRIEYMLKQTIPHRLTPTGSSLILDDMLCEHVGSLFECVDRHYHHCNSTYPLSHNLVTSHYLSGAVRLPVDFEVYRRYEEVTEWETFVTKHFPDESIPQQGKARSAFHKRVDPVLMRPPDFAARHQLFCTKIEIAQLLIDQAIPDECTG